MNKWCKKGSGAEKILGKIWVKLNLKSLVLVALVILGKIWVNLSLWAKLLGRRVGRHTRWADTLRRFLIWILEFGFFFFLFSCVLGCDAKSMNGTEKNRKSIEKNEKHTANTKIEMNQMRKKPKNSIPQIAFLTMPLPKPVRDAVKAARRAGEWNSIPLILQANMFKQFCHLAFHCHETGCSRCRTKSRHVHRQGELRARRLQMRSTEFHRFHVSLSLDSLDAGISYW